MTDRPRQTRRACFSAKYLYDAVETADDDSVPLEATEQVVNTRTGDVDSHMQMARAALRALSSSSWCLQGGQVWGFERPWQLPSLAKAWQGTRRHDRIERSCGSSTYGASSGGLATNLPGCHGAMYLRYIGQRLCPVKTLSDFGLSAAPANESSK